MKYRIYSTVGHNCVSKAGFRLVGPYSRTAIVLGEPRGFGKMDYIPVENVNRRLLHIKAGELLRADGEGQKHTLIECHPDECTEEAAILVAKPIVRVAGGCVYTGDVASCVEYHGGKRKWEFKPIPSNVEILCSGMAGWVNKETAVSEHAFLLPRDTWLRVKTYGKHVKTEGRYFCFTEGKMLCMTWIQREVAGLVPEYERLDPFFNY